MRKRGDDVTNFFWPSPTLSIFIVTFNDIDDEIALDGLVVNSFLQRDYQRVDIFKLQWNVPTLLEDPAPAACRWGKLSIIMSSHKSSSSSKLFSKTSFAEFCCRLLQNVGPK
jgi:hypothetical protein